MQELFGKLGVPLTKRFHEFFIIRSSCLTRSCAMFCFSGLVASIFLEAGSRSERRDCSSESDSLARDSVLRSRISWIFELLGITYHTNYPTFKFIVIGEDVLQGFEGFIQPDYVSIR